MWKCLEIYCENALEMLWIYLKCVKMCENSREVWKSENMFGIFKKLCRKDMEMFGNYWKCVKMVKNWWKCVKMGGNRWKWVKMGENVQKPHQNGWKRKEMFGFNYK